MKQKRKIIHDVRMQIMERLLDKFADTFDAMNLSMSRGHVLSLIIIPRVNPFSSV